MTRLLAGVLLAVLTAAPARAGLEQGEAGVAEGSSGGPTVPACTVADLFSPADRPAAVELTADLPGHGLLEGAAALRLSTSPLDGSPDQLRQSRWRLVFEAKERSRLSLALAFHTEDDGDWSDWFLVALDGQAIACGTAGSLTLDDGRSGWMGFGLDGEILVEPGVHVFEAAVGDGFDRSGRSDLLIDALQLVPATRGVAPPPTPCRPSPPEDVGEIPNDCILPPIDSCSDPLVCVSPRRTWTFDDNRFCPNGSAGRDSDNDGLLECLNCSRPEDVGDPNPPGSCFECTDATDRFFEMYVVADCGTEMHLPLNDVESGCISIFDQDRNPVDIVVQNGAGFFEEGGEVCWMAEDCDGNSANDPGGPGDARTMDVSFTADPSLCGVFVARFRSWAGCIWDLFANCDGTNTEQFLIFDDFCEAEDAYDPLPELIVENLETSPGDGCTVDYCVTVRNIGCRNSMRHDLRVANELDEMLHDVPVLQSGDSVQFCGTLDLDETAPDPHVTRVRAFADWNNDLLECTEDTTASSCNAATGGDVVEEVQVVNCNTDPTCDAGGPYSAECGQGGVPGATRIPLDGTGSSDPNGDPLSYFWTTNCPNGAFVESPSTATPTLVLNGPQCDVECEVFLTVTDPSGGSSSCSAPVGVDDTLAPELDCPADYSAECGDPDVLSRDEWLDTAAAADACDPNASVVRQIRFQSSPCADSRREVWDFRAVDACGNESLVCQRTWEVLDTRPPVLALPDDRVVECPPDPDADANAWADQATAVDDCIGPVLVQRELVSVEPGCGGTEIRTYRFTARDRCGNLAEGTRTWTSVDTMPPQLRNVPPDQSVSCDALPAPAPVRADDDCDPDATVELNETREDGSCPDSYTLVRTWTGRDGCGNETSASQRITVTDLDPPTLEGVPPDTEALCGQVPDPPFVDAVDDCDPAPAILFEEQVEPGSCPDDFVLVRTWTARDRCGNETSQSQRITVSDDEPPVLQLLPPDQVVPCDLIPPPATVIAVDNCDPNPTLVFEETDQPGDCPDERTIFRTWTATDRCGNESSHTQQITVVDRQPPVLLGVPPDGLFACDAVPPAGAVSAADNCDPAPRVVLVETRTDGDCPDRYELVRTWTATDRCGNARSQTQRLTVMDDTAPELVGLPPDGLVSCEQVPPPEAVTALDDCDPAPLVEFEEIREPGDCPDSYTLRRRWTATDRCGNSTTAEQLLDVVDATAPELIGVPEDRTVSCDNIPPPPPVTATDNCDPDPVVLFEERRSDGACEDDFQLIRIWTAIDRCGNETVAEQVLSITVTVTDEIPPVLLGVPADATVECDAVPEPASVSATDNCDPLPVVSFSEQTTPLACPDNYLITRTWTAVDRCGNESAQSQVLTVVDTTPPVLAGVPADETVECDAIPEPSSPTASDDCDPAPAIVFEELRTDGPCLDEYTLTRTWTAVDRCGNASSEVQVLTVVDTTAPVLAGVPADETVECEAIPEPASPTASDDCDPAPVIAFEELRTDGDCPYRYTLTRTWTATDRCGNSSEQVQVVTVVDTTPPVVSPPGDLVVECPAPGAGPDSEAGWRALATATDNCGTPEVFSQELSRTPGCGLTYTAVFEFWAVDECGNESLRIERSYEVVDTTPPVVVPPDDIVVECPAPESGPGSEDEWLGRATASDTCGGAEVLTELVERIPGCGNTYTDVWDFWARDECGNESARQRRQYEVVDTTPPVFDRAEPLFEESLWPPNHGYVVFATGEMASATDACGEVTLAVTGCASSQPEEVHQGPTEDGGNGDGRTFEDCVWEEAGSEFAARAERLGACGPGSARLYSVEITATDECGNSASAAGLLVVQHDRRSKQPTRRGKKLGPNDPPPWPHVHETTYGEDCGPGGRRPRR